MSGTLLLAKAEISRLRRNKRYLIFTVALPVMFWACPSACPRSADACRWARRRMAR